jgi:hypothetical protein
LSAVEIVIVPWASGSGKFGTPWERMQAVYLTPASPVPTCVDMLAPVPPTLGGNNLELRLALLLLLLEGVVPRLATDDDFAPPPQPAASSARLASPAASKTSRG